LKTEEYQMAVFRVERTNNYTVMSNYHLRDKGLSLKAKGLLSLMLSLPEDWDYTLTGLARISLEGKDAIRAAVVELEKAGYIQRSQTTGRDGKFSNNEYIIRERPTAEKLSPEGPSSEEPSSEEPPSAQPSSDKPLSENPTTEKPSPGKPTQINIDSRNKEKQNTELSSTDSFPFPSTPSPEQTEGTRRERKRERRSMSEAEMESYRAVVRANIEYDTLVRERPCDERQLDELVELMVEAVCSKRKTIRVSGNDFPQMVVKSRLLKLDREHIVFVLDSLRENTTKVRNIKQYLLAVLYNAPVTIENYYAARVNHDLYDPTA